MLEAPTSAHPLLRAFDGLEGLLAALGSADLHAARRAARDRFAAVGMPTVRDEEFKYLPLGRFEGIEFGPAYGATVSRGEVEALTLGKLDAITLAFVNGEFAPELSSADALPAGVWIGSLRDALESGDPRITDRLGRLATYEGKLGSTNDARFVDLNTAYLAEGAVVFVPRGVALERPIHLQYLVRADHGPLAMHPRNLIVLEENAVAKVVESYSALGDGVSFTNAVTEIDVAPAANLEHVRFQSESTQSLHVANVFARQGENSTWTSNLASFGGAVARTDVNVFVAGEHAETALNGAYVGTGEQIVDCHTRIDHALPNCHSFEIYKGILDDRAQGVFNGKIFVYEDAQKTDAKQSNQAILLSPTAAINTKPQLEIFADDVKCTHGATVGQLREDALFYLRARGIPERQARALLVYAFAAEVLEKIGIDEVRDTLEAILFERLGTGN